MENNNEEKVDLINFDIEVNVSQLPKILLNIIEELEGYEKENDWVMYYGVSEGLEAAAKQCLMDGLISQGMFKKLLKKYGGYA